MVAQDVTHVLTEEALDALAVLINALRVFRQHPVRDRLIRRRRESGDLLVDFVVPRDVRDQVLDQRERAHRPDMDLLIDKLVDTRLAHQPRPAVDLGATRAALGGLAVPAAGEVVRKVRLDIVDRVEHHHALDRRHLKALFLTATGVAAEDLEHDRTVGGLARPRGSAHRRTGCGWGGLGDGADGVGHVCFSDADDADRDCGDGFVGSFGEGTKCGFGE